jgi:ParB-like chromosome segregation protein Spo0J
MTHPRITGGGTVVISRAEPARFRWVTGLDRLVQQEGSCRCAQRESSIRVAERTADVIGSPGCPEPGSPGSAGGWTAHTIPRASIRGGYSPRLAGENLSHVQTLAQTDVRLPPILVHRQTMQVIDGMHRLRAAQQRGEQTVEVQFFDGDENEAFAAAVQANVAHGLPLTLADRKAAATRIIAGQPHRSDRWIADVAGLAPGTVGAIRRQNAAPEQEGTTRIGRDGRARPLNPADGRLKAQQEMSGHPDASLREIARSAGISTATAKNVRDRLLRGDDPVPREKNAARHGQAPAGGKQTTRGDDNGSPRGAGADIASSVAELAKDPSLRYTESGRALLRLLELQAQAPGSVQALTDEVPPHCGYLVADIARECARQWRALAATLEQRLRTMPPAPP